MDNQAERRKFKNWGTPEDGSKLILAWRIGQAQVSRALAKVTVELFGKSRYFPLEFSHLELHKLRDAVAHQLSRYNHTVTALGPGMQKALRGFRNCLRHAAAGPL